MKPAPWEKERYREEVQKLNRAKEQEKEKETQAKRQKKETMEESEPEEVSACFSLMVWFTVACLGLHEMLESSGQLQRFSEEYVWLDSGLCFKKTL